LREEGDSFLDELVAQFGYDPQLIAQESEASAIKERLEAQRAEFAAYEFKGTPAYIAAGIPMQGPLPFRELENIICNELRRTSFTAAASPSAVDNSDCWALVKPDWKRLYELDNDRPLPAETP